MIGRILPAGDIDIYAAAWTSGAAYACQKIKQRLRFLRGEWCWDRSLGISYYRDILVKSPNLPLIREIYKSEILKVPGIVAVPELTLDLDTASRLLSVTFTATFSDETESVSVSGTV
jgi:hypothetical protein